VRTEFWLVTTEKKFIVAMLRDGFPRKIASIAQNRELEGAPQAAGNA